MSLLLCLPGLSLGRYCQKSVVKSWGFRKKDKKGDGHTKGGCPQNGEGGFKHPAHHAS